MILHFIFLVALSGGAAQTTAPRCQAEPGRKAEQLRGEVTAHDLFSHVTPSGWMLRLVPDAEGWLLEVTTQDRENENLARLTPPWHGVPNPRSIAGWHFRNADNTGPNDGSVNAPQALREFIFSPQVGRGIEYHGSATTAADVAKVRAFGRGWLHIHAYRLTPPRKGERAAFESLAFSGCLTWPAG